MPFIIFFMAVSFSDRNGASAVAAETVVAQMSCSDSDPSWAETTNAAPIANPIVRVTAPSKAKRRRDQLISASLDQCAAPRIDLRASGARKLGNAAVSRS